MRRADLMMRQAISPRFAIRIRLNMLWFVWRPWAGAIWHGGREVTIPSYSKTRPRQRYMSTLRGLAPRLPNIFSRNTSEIFRVRRHAKPPSSARRPLIPDNRWQRSARGSWIAYRHRMQRSPARPLPQAPHLLARSAVNSTTSEHSGNWALDDVLFLFTQNQSASLSDPKEKTKEKRPRR